MGDGHDDDWYDPDVEDYTELVGAVSWAYQKLIAFGVGNNDRDALMLDVLKLFIEEAQ